jgi:hypothetical protein
MHSSMASSRQAGIKGARRGRDDDMERRQTKFLMRAKRGVNSSCPRIRFHNLNTVHFVIDPRAHLRECEHLDGRPIHLVRRLPFQLELDLESVQ